MEAESIGAFLSGAGAMLSGIASLRVLQKRMHKECDDRIKELHDTLHEGIEIGERKE